MREKKSKVFEEKLKIYERFLETIKNVTQDNKITVDSNSDELKELIFELSMVKMHSSGKSTQTVINRLQDMNDLLNSEDIESGFDYQRFSEILFEIVDIFQYELYEGSLGTVEVDLKGLMDKLVVRADSGERFFSELDLPHLKPFIRPTFIEMDGFIRDVLKGLESEYFYHVNGINNIRTIDFKASYRINIGGSIIDLFILLPNEYSIDIELPPGVENITLPGGNKIDQYQTIEAPYQWNDVFKDSLVAVRDFILNSSENATS